MRTLPTPTNDNELLSQKKIVAPAATSASFTKDIIVKTASIIPKQPSQNSRNPVSSAFENYYIAHTTDFFLPIKEFRMTEKHMTPDYQKRSSTFGFASKETLAEWLAEDSPDTTLYVLDVRTEKEIQDQGAFTPKHATNKHVSITPEDATELKHQVEKGLFGDTPKEDTKIIVLCRSGRRASTAQTCLHECGFTHVVNAGGYEDIVAMGLDQM
jgi:rhodanese-related sulfurtransferase